MGSGRRHDKALFKSDIFPLRECPEGNTDQWARIRLHVSPTRFRKEIRATATCFAPCNRRFGRRAGEPHPGPGLQSGFGGGAAIPDHFGGKKATSQDENAGQRCAAAKTAEALA